LCSRPRKGTSLGGTACFGVLCVKIRSVPLALASCKNPKKLTRFWCAKSRMRRNDTPGRIVTNICTCVGVHDVITSANFYDCRLWGLSVVGGQILGFSIDSHCRPYNTLALPCECVIHTTYPANFIKAADHSLNCSSDSVNDDKFKPPTK